MHFMAYLAAGLSFRETDYVMNMADQFELYQPKAPEK